MVTIPHVVTTGPVWCYSGFGCSLFFCGSKKCSTMASTNSSNSFFRLVTSLVTAKKNYHYKTEAVVLDAKTLTLSDG